MGGTNLGLAKAIVAAAGKDCRVTIAGGVTTADEIRELDEIGADAQVGMALYTGRLDLADAIMAPLVTDRADGLYPVVVDERGVCLGLVYSSKDRSARPCDGGWASTSPARAASGSRARPVAPRRSCFGSTSTATATARASSSASPVPASATSIRTCWGEDQGLGRLARTLVERREQSPRGATPPSCSPIPELLSASCSEEANELAEARDREHVLWEAADVLYFTLARLAREGIDLAEVEAHLDRRALKVTRRE